MRSSFHRLGIVLAIMLPALSLGGCGTLNEKLAAGMSDTIPQWAGGLPRDAPPRPGPAEYDVFIKTAKRLEPAPHGDTQVSWHFVIGTCTLVSGHIDGFPNRSTTNPLTNCAHALTLYAVRSWESD
jgi:hypothetical protein